MPGLDDGDAIQRLYNAYESDRKAIIGYTSQLASAIFAIVCDRHDQTRFDQGISSVHKILTDFDGAIARISHASHFVHDPGYMGDDWGIHWRTVQFHGYGILEGGTGDLSDWKLKRTMCMGRAGPTCKSSLTLRKVIESPSQERKGPSWRRSSEGPGHLALSRTVFIEEDAVKPPTQGTDWYAEVAAARTLVTLQQGSGIVHIET